MAREAADKIQKSKAGVPNTVELETAKALLELESAAGGVADVQAAAKRIVIRGARTVELRDGKQPVVIICTPYRVYVDYVRPVQGRLTAELEKKMRKFVVFFAQRKILPKDFKKKGLKFRPRSRTLQCVHNAILEDIVAPVDIVGKRTRCRADGKQLLRIELDPVSKEQSELKLEAYAAAYQTLTRKQAIFQFPDSARE
eukprot:Lankesteria_metandrocarpae@DN685_c0_g1_i1.p1